VVANLDRARHALFGGAAVGVPEASADVAGPCGHHTLYAARPDQLVEQDVGDRPDQREVAPLLADDLVAGGEGNQRLERAADRYGVAVADVASDRVGHGEELGGH
jgi:hypothetical protein